jgi:hypothetical protein
LFDHSYLSTSWIQDQTKRANNLRFPSFSLIRNNTEPVFASKGDTQLRKHFIVNAGFELSIQGVCGGLAQGIPIDIFDDPVKLI